jgi:hypothetical protein
MLFLADENFGRILLTHDVQTMPAFACERMDAGLPMPGVIEIRLQLPIGQVIEDLLMIIGANDEAEWQNRVVYLPLSRAKST